ncbi:hypothetical protein EXT48_21605 [Pseudoalteromonas sp. CO348]|uniref:hypothetical protein n=1 Tax=Pseudoalteromonas sp. CO348 TaxID=1777271 RepID=UPI001022EABE|nr:hypothetical protein [Pseudoalteromonas sp. CO348]RZF98655.1 hypothetical protein EXT48_21605 [Pseudoalteromonas sp. CO348]
MKKLSAIFAFLSMAVCLLWSFTGFASAWLPVHTQYIMNTFEQHQLEDKPVWINPPSNPVTHQTITFQWSADLNVSRYELWLNGSKHTYTTNRAEFYFTEPELKAFKVRACNGQICSPFSQLLELNVKKRLEVVFGEQGVIEAGANAQITLSLLEQLQATDKIEFSLDKSVWHSSAANNAQFTYPVNVSEPGLYQLHVKINGQIIKPITFRVYGQPTKAVSNLAIGKVAQLDYQNQQTLVLNSPEDLILHWQASDEIAPPNTGYYKYRIENGDEGIIYRTAPYLNYQYGHDVFHKEIPIKSNGKYDIALRGCNRLGTGEVCGPTQVVHVYVGVPATPYRQPTQPVSGVYINGVLGDTTRNDFIQTEPDSTAYLSWAKLPEVDAERGYYLIEIDYPQGHVDYPQGHTRQGLVFGTAPYIARRYKDNDFHYEMRFDAAQQDYIVAVRGCNPYSETGGFEVNCGPRSQAVRIKSKPAEVKYDVSYRGITNKLGFVDQEVIAVIQTQNNGVLKRLEAKLDNGEWVSLTSSDGKSFIHNFGLLPVGEHTIVYRADSYYDSEEFTFNVRVPLKLVEVKDLALSSRFFNYGDKVTISWQKPTYYDGPLVYDVYITKPNAPHSAFLWRSKLDPSAITVNGRYQVERGPLYMRGEHLVQVVPCTPEGVCAARSGGVTYSVGGDVLPQVARFDVLSAGINKAVTFDWAMPESFTSDVVATYWVKAPNAAHLVEYQPNSPFTTFGTYFFYVSVCEAGSPLICNKYLETELRIQIIPTELVAEHNGRELTWESVSGATSVVIESALCADASSCDMASLDWSTLKKLENGETSLALSDSEGKIYRIKVCFADGTCTSWISVVKAQPKKQVIFIHTDLLGNPVAETVL